MDHECSQRSQNRGQAMGPDVFSLFTGFGFGSLLSQALLLASFTTALVVFRTATAVAAA